MSNTGDNGGAAYTNHRQRGAAYANHARAEHGRDVPLLRDGLRATILLWRQQRELRRLARYRSGWILEPDELVDSWTTTQPFEIHSINTSIDFAALIGYTRLRVMTVFNGGALDPCGSYSYGECEDYMVLIEDGARCIPLIPYGTSDGDEITNVALGGVALSAPSAGFPWINGDWIGRQLVMGAT
ncbi:MAG: hypothetical protein IPM46_16345 [Flavobacteriales bacterium]|nr:hypothetical protein [Flavobacteriales bacterium]